MFLIFVLIPRSKPNVNLGNNDPNLASPLLPYTNLWIALPSVLASVLALLYSNFLFSIPSIPKDYPKLNH